MANADTNLTVFGNEANKNVPVAGVLSQPSAGTHKKACTIRQAYITAYVRNDLHERTQT